MAALGRRRGNDERGAVALVTGLLVVVLLMIAAFVVDLGMQRVARRDMQALADMVAVDLARELDGREVAALAPLMPGLADAARQRNADTLGSAPALEVDLGSVSATGVFTEMTAGVPSAVRVTAATEVAFAFGGVTDTDSGSATRASLATASAGACFRLGSITATIDSADAEVLGSFEQLVGAALGVRIDAASYRALADVFVHLSDVAVEMGVGTVEELVAARSVAVADLVAATGRAMARDGATAAQTSLVTGLASRISTTLRIDVGDILSVGGPSALTAQTGVLDLIMASAFAIDGDSLLDTGVIWNEPHVSAGDVLLQVLEAPKQACGLVDPATRATTAQLQLDADLRFNLPNKIGSLDVTNATDLTTKEASLLVRARMGGAEGYLSDLQCGAGTVADPESIAVTVSTYLADNSILLDYRLRGTISDRSLIAEVLPGVTLPAGRLLELELDVVGRTSGSLVSPPGPSQETTYAVPPHTYGDAGEPVDGSQPVQLPRATTSVLAVDRFRLTLAGVPVLGVSASRLDLTPVVTGTVIDDSVNAVAVNVNEVLSPVSALFGIRTGGADLFGIPRPTCAVPRLVG